MAQSAKWQWIKGDNKRRNALLKAAGYTSHRTLTLRNYEDLPPEVKIDLDYSVRQKVPEHHAA